MKAVAQVKNAIEAETRNSLEINYEKAAAEVINKVKQDLSTKEIEQRLKQEIERQKLNETLSRSVPMPEAEVRATKSGNCNTLKMMTGKPFGITKVGARIMSIITVGGHEVTRNLSEPSETFATRNNGSSERGGRKSRKTFKKPKEFKDDSDGCIDTWVEVMKLHLEQNNLSDERQTCTAILCNLEGTAVKCVVAKKEEERDTAEEIFEILLNRFGSGRKSHQAMMRIEKKRQMDDESIDRFWMILRA